MEVLDRIVPDNARVAQLAAQVIGLDFAGIDLVVPDIARSIWETGGAIIEVNSHPGIIDHLQPGTGPARDVGAAVLEALFPPGYRCASRSSLCWRTTYPPSFVSD